MNCDRRCLINYVFIKRDDLFFWFIFIFTIAKMGKYTDYCFNAQMETAVACMPKSFEISVNSAVIYLYFRHNEH